MWECTKCLFIHSQVNPTMFVNHKKIHKACPQAILTAMYMYMCTFLMSPSKDCVMQWKFQGNPITPNKLKNMISQVGKCVCQKS